MLSNTLLRIEPILTKRLNQQTTNAVLDFLKNYKENTGLYPGVLRRKFNISLTDVYAILEEMVNLGVLQSYYEMYCSNCQKSMGIVHVFNELPDTFMCELCDNELSTLENTTLVYRML